MGNGVIFKQNTTNKTGHKRYILGCYSTFTLLEYIEKRNKANIKLSWILTGIYIVYYRRKILDID